MRTLTPHVWCWQFHMNIYLPRWYCNYMYHSSEWQVYAHDVAFWQTKQIWGIWKLQPAYRPQTPNLGQNQQYFVPCDLEIWRITLKDNRASLLCFKLCASFHSHRWIQTVVTVRKLSSGVLTSVILTFDLWPWPFVWTSSLSKVMNPENFMMIRWWKHSD